MKNYYRFEMNLKILNIFAIALFVIGYIIIKGLGFDLWENSGGPIIFIYMFIWFLLHEAIHGIGFSLLDKKDRKKIVFGIELEKGIFYCMCKQAISKKNVILALVLPLIIIGFITLGIGITIKSNILLILSLVNISGAAGDIVMTLALLKMKNIEYLDIDDTTGFYILSKNDISNKKYLGLKIVESGKYNPNTMVAKDYRRLKITKKSFYIIIGLIIFTIILNILGGVL